MRHWRIFEKQLLVCEVWQKSVRSFLAVMEEIIVLLISPEGEGSSFIRKTRNLPSVRYTPEGSTFRGV
jgi:hypothetical protein